MAEVMTWTLLSPVTEKQKETRSVGRVITTSSTLKEKQKFMNKKNQIQLSREMV